MAAAAPPDDGQPSDDRQLPVVSDLPSGTLILTASPTPNIHKDGTYRWRRGTSWILGRVVGQTLQLVGCYEEPNGLKASGARTARPAARRITAEEYAKHLANWLPLNVSQYWNRPEVQIEALPLKGPVVCLLTGDEPLPLGREFEVYVLSNPNGWLDTLVAATSGSQTARNGLKYLGYVNYELKTYEGTDLSHNGDVTVKGLANDDASQADFNLHIVHVGAPIGPGQRRTVYVVVNVYQTPPDTFVSDYCPKYMFSRRGNSPVAFVATPVARGSHAAIVAKLTWCDAQETWLLSHVNQCAGTGNHDSYMPDSMLAHVKSGI
jgi:hypothetical protein